MKTLCYEHPDGVAVIYPNPANRKPDETEDEFLARVLARNIEVAAQKDRLGNVANPHLTGATDVLVVDASEVPPRDRRAHWFGGLKASGGKRVSQGHNGPN